MISIQRIKSMYGFFFAGLRLGSDGYKIGEEGDEVNMDEDKKKPTCSRIFGQLTAPILGGGVEVRF